MSEPTNPELSLDLLRAELDAARAEIDGLRRLKAKVRAEAQTRADIIRALWPAVLNERCWDGSDGSLAAWLARDGVLSEDAAQELMRVLEDQ